MSPRVSTDVLTLARVARQPVSPSTTEAEYRLRLAILGYAMGATLDAMAAPDYEPNDRCLAFYNLLTRASELILTWMRTDSLPDARGILAEAERIIREGA